MALVLTPEHLELRQRDEPNLAASLLILLAERWRTDANSAVVAVRRWRKRWALKAIICRMWWTLPQGWGAMPLCWLRVGCRVRMLERNPVVAALLDDGLARGYADVEIGGWLQERLQLIHASSLTALTDITPRPQVVYLDPMFPHKQKSALVKKRCASFSRWWDRDHADGSTGACTLAGDQTRSSANLHYAPPLANVATPNAVVTKGHRFDIYAGTPSVDVPPSYCRAALSPGSPQPSPPLMLYN